MTLLIRLLSITVALSLIGIGTGLALGTWQGEFVAVALMPALFVGTVVLGVAQLLQARKKSLR